MGQLEVDDSKLMRYPSGKVFIRYHYAGLTGAWADDMHRNVQQQFDNVVVIHGPEGSGKSNLAYQICKAYDPNFDVAAQYVYNYEDFIRKISTDNDHAVYWMDEASNMVNNRDWNTDSNKSIVNILEMFRSRGWTLVMCIPHAERLDKYIRENRIRYLAKCEPMDFDTGGHRDRGYYELSKRDIYGRLKHVGYGTYEPMPPDVKEVYERIKLDAQDAKIQELARRITPTEKEDGYKKRYDDGVGRRRRAVRQMAARGLSDSEIMDILGYKSYKTYHNDKTIAMREGDDED